jgi:hypothetical protein
MAAVSLKELRQLVNRLEEELSKCPEVPRAYLVRKLRRSFAL